MEHPKWLANIVLAPKKNGQVKVCMDFKDLNKASPKDNLTLPHMDMLMDSFSPIYHSWIIFHPFMGIFALNIGLKSTTIFLHILVLNWFSNVEFNVDFHFDTKPYPCPLSTFQYPMGLVSKWMTLKGFNLFGSLCISIP